MDRFAGDLSTYDLSEVVRSLFLERATGVLEVTVDSGKRRLFFVDGELHLPPSNPLALQVTKKLSEGASPGEIEDLMGRVAGVIDAWREGSFAFDPGRAAVPPDAVGPLPTADLVMAAAVMNRDEQALLERLGGEQARWVGRTTKGRLGMPDWSHRLATAEAALQELLTEPRAVGEMLVEAQDRKRLLQRLSRLAALGVIERFGPKAPADTLIDDEVIGRFGERVGRELAQRPIVLDGATHRARLAELLGRLGELNHYELLGVAPDSSTEQIHAAYGELARLVHPSHAERLGFRGREQAINLLFERATEAYLILSDPDRRGRYNRDASILSSSQSPDRPEGPQRSPELAARLFEQAKEMVQRDELHYAFELLRQAVRADRKAEYYALMAEVQQRNSNWLHHAVDSLREAVNLAPENLSYRHALAQLYAQTGDQARARAVYRSILVRAPGNAEAVEGLETLDGKPKKKTGGFLSGLFKIGSS